MANNIAIAKNEEVLAYLRNGLVDSPDTIAARYEQQKGLEVFRETDQMLSKNIEAMQDLEFHKIYWNRSGCRTRFDEFARVSLTSVERT